MATYDWKNMTERLSKMVHVYAPVGMRWVRTAEEFAAIPKVRVHEKHYPPCVIVSQSHQLGWTVGCMSENYHANYCRGVHGMFQRDEKWYSGGMFNEVWFDNLEASQAHNQAITCVPAEYYAIVCSPLDAGRVEEPDVCVLYTSSAQAFMLFAGWQFKEYEKLAFSFVGESTCSDSWCYTKNTGKPGFAIPSFADRKFGAVGEWEVRCTFTPEGLLRAIEGVECMHKTGLRYPIASYSLTTDIIPGLPPHYLDY